MIAGPKIGGCDGVVEDASPMPLSLFPKLPNMEGGCADCWEDTPKNDMLPGALLNILSVVIEGFAVDAPKILVPDVILVVDVPDIPLREETLGLLCVWGMLDPIPMIEELLGFACVWPSVDKFPNMPAPKVEAD